MTEQEIVTLGFTIGRYYRPYKTPSADLYAEACADIRGGRATYTSDSDAFASLLAECSGPEWNRWADRVIGQNGNWFVQAQRKSDRAEELAEAREVELAGMFSLSE